jgi:sensor histidine kinase regulating citrate/malate metabolism
MKAVKAQFLVNKILKDELKTKYNLKKVLKKTCLDFTRSACKIHDLVVILGNLIKNKLNKIINLNYQTT